MINTNNKPLPFNVVLVCTLLSLYNCSLGSDTSNRTPETDSSEAKQIAIETFIQNTNGEIKDYKIKSIDQNQDYWTYMIEGVNEFARPGYHWTVRVRKTDKRPEIIGGE